MRPVPTASIERRARRRSTPNSSSGSRTIAARHPGVLLEDKGYSLALHYRLAPEQGLGLVHEYQACL